MDSYKGLLYITSSSIYNNCNSSPSSLQRRFPILLRSWIKTKDSHGVRCRSFHRQEEERFFEEKLLASRDTLVLQYLYDVCIYVYKYPKIIT